MFSRMRSRKCDGVLRASVSPCVEALEGRRLLSATASNPGGAPNAPFGLAATATGPTAVSFSFYDSATNETGFLVSRAVGNGAFAPLTTLNSSPGSFTQVTLADANLVAGTTYRYEVAAVNGVYSSSTPNPVSVTTTAGSTPTNPPPTTSNPGGVPNAPFGLAASANPAGGIAVSFYDSASNETSFTVLRATSVAGPFTTVTTLPASTASFAKVSYSDTSTTPGTTYYYSVNAVNGPYASSTPAPVSATAAGVSPPPTSSTPTTPAIDSSFGTNGDFRNNFQSNVLSRLAVSPDGSTTYTLYYYESPNGGSYVGASILPVSSKGVAGTPIHLDKLLSESIGLPSAITVQPDGKILVAGGGNKGDLIVARFNPDGTLDTSFGNAAGELIVNYQQNDHVAGVAVAADGKILVGGDFTTGSGATQGQFFAVRLNPNGSLDSTFGYSGMTKGDAHDSVNAWAMVVDPTDESAIVVGITAKGGKLTNTTNTDVALGGARLGASGNPTSLINYLGATGHDAVLQPDGKIVVAGTVGTQPALVRFNTDGTLDTTWTPLNLAASIPQLSSGEALSLTRLADGSYVVVGEGLDASGGDASFVTHVGPDGAISPAVVRDLPVTFKTSAIDDYDVQASPDGSIYVLGAIDFALLITKFHV